MPRRHRQIVGFLLMLMLGIGIVTYTRRLPSSPPPSPPTAQVHQESYDLGYQNGYQIAKTEHATAYREGYEAAQREIGSGALTRFGIGGFLLGFCLSVGGFVALKRQEVAAFVADFRKRRAVKKTFQRMPTNLSPDMETLAHQIAQAYVTVLQQLRNGRGYVVEQYAKQWRGKLQALMQHTLRLFETVRDLEAARAKVNEPELAKTMRALQRQVQNPATDDVARHVALNSLQRVKQTRQEFLLTGQNLTQCQASLQGIAGTLETMRLKISNLTVNTQQTDILDELSADLESEMRAITEALTELRN